MLVARRQLQLGRLDPAWRAAQTAAAIDPFRIDVYALLSELAQLRGDSAAAADYAERAKRIATLSK